MYLRKLRDMIGRNESRMSHPDLQLSRIQRDEADIQSLVDLMDTSWINALSPDQAEFVRVFIATLAPPNVAKGLIETYSVGARISGKKVWRQIHPLATQFHDKMTKLNLITKRSHAKAKDVALKADRNLFRHMIIVAQS